MSATTRPAELTAEQVMSCPVASIEDTNNLWLAGDLIHAIALHGVFDDE